MALGRRRLYGVGLALGVILTAACAPAAAAPVALAPYRAGTFGPGSGANASFLQIDSAWRGSTVLWDEATASFGSGVPIGSLSWGDGLWGRADWDAAQAAAAGGSGPPIIGAWSGQAATINYSNALYNRLYAGLWGPAQLLPLFDAATPDSAQENWTARFWGYIRVTAPGSYNFSVLNDDGFFFRLIGAGGQALQIERDYVNPRDRNGFADDLLLREGLYGFELGMWNRLEVGVVDLRWSSGDSDWTLVPVENLATSIPSPGTLALLLAGLGALPLVRLGAERQRILGAPIG